MDALTLNRIHFAFTIAWHNLGPQLTIGLALFIVVLRQLAPARLHPAAHQIPPSNIQPLCMDSRRTERKGNHDSACGCAAYHRRR
jgi:hypothetical protein